MTDDSQRPTPEILDAVREVEAEAAGGAEALCMAAMLAPSPLPYDFALALEGTLHNPSLANPAAAFFAATATLDELVTRSLVLADVASQTFTLPDDVRAAILGSLSDEDKYLWASRAAYGLNLILPDAAPDQWPAYEWLMPHVLACRDLAADMGLATEATGRVLHQAGHALHYRQRHREGAALLESALAVDMALKGKEHPDICADLEAIGTVLWAGGDLERAERALASCLELQKIVFTPDNPVTASVLNSLGVVRQQRGLLDRAEEAFRECLRVLTLAHGEGHPAIASCLSNYALLCEAAGKPGEALRLAERALEINRALHGEDHPEVASDLNTVALLHESLGNDAAAEDHFRQSLAARRRLFGTDHPETAQSLCNLALLLDKLDRTNESAELYERGLAAYEATLGPTHPLMEAALDNYLRLLETTGRRPKDDHLRARAEARLRQIVERAD